MAWHLPWSWHKHYLGLTVAFLMAGLPRALQERGHCLWLSVGWGCIPSPRQAGSMPMSKVDAAAGLKHGQGQVSCSRHPPCGHMALS